MPRGRKPKGQEFVETLLEATGLSQAKFAKACGKQSPNMTQYLNGRLDFGKHARKTAVEKLRDGWPVTPVMEVEPIPTSLAKLPPDPGIYALYNSAGEVLYVGQAKNLRSEVKQTLDREVNLTVRLGPKITKKAHPQYERIAKYISIYVVDKRYKNLRHNLEALLLRVFPNQSHNDKMGNFKSR